MEDIKINVTFSLVLTEEDVKNITCCMIENGGYGVGYWCNEISAPDDKWLGEYTDDQLVKGGKLIFHTVEPFDEEGTEYYTLDLEKFRNGVQMYAANTVNNDCFEVKDGELRFDCCNVDAIVADEILQYALFGELVYG